MRQVPYYTVIMLVVVIFLLGFAAARCDEPKNCHAWNMGAATCTFHDNEQPA